MTWINGVWHCQECGKRTSNVYLCPACIAEYSGKWCNRCGQIAPAFINGVARDAWLTKSGWKIEYHHGEPALMLCDRCAAKRAMDIVNDEMKRIGARAAQACLERLAHEEQIKLDGCKIALGATVRATLISSAVLCPKCSHCMVRVNPMSVSCTNEMCELYMVGFEPPAVNLVRNR